MDAIHDLDQLFRHWLSAIVLFGSHVHCETPARIPTTSSRTRRFSLPTMSQTWLLEHEIASGKHQDES